MKPLYLFLAFFTFALGAIGAFLPVLPTVPFLLLSSYFFAKGSDRWHRWFTGTKLYQDHLESFARDRAMTLKTKLSILLPVTGILILCMVLAPNIFMRAGLGCIIVIKYWYFFTKIKTIA